MTFKIVSTRRRGRVELCTVPSQWESDGLLRWPKHNTKLCKDDSVEPGSDWEIIPCSVKRQNFGTYQEAEEELINMLNKSDTEPDIDFNPERITRHGSKQKSKSECPCFNSIAQNLINSSQVTANVTSIKNTNPVITDSNGVIYEIVNTGGQTIENLQTQQQSASNLDAMLQHINNIYTIQNVIMSSQEKIMKKMAEFSIQLDQLQYNHQPLVTTLSQADGMQTKQMIIKAIDDIRGLEQLENQLSTPDTFEDLRQKYSIICSPKIHTGFNCAYRLLDALFTKDFLCKCTWTGGSRNAADVKVAFKCFKNVIRFFFEMVYSWDKTYTMQDNEVFLKTVLRNALKRKESKNIRQSAQKKRAKKNVSVIKNNKKDDSERTTNKENDSPAMNENIYDSNSSNKINYNDKNYPDSIDGQTEISTVTVRNKINDEEEEYEESLC